jgi:CheY-specific phosphatase CheX
MFEENSEVRNQIQLLAATAAAELLKAYGVEATPAASGWVQTDELMYSGVMGFVGDGVRGTCLLAARSATVLAAAPPDARPRDWVGELANQLVGRLKSKLLARNVSIAMTTPVVLSGVRIEPLPRTHVEPAVFDTATGKVLVWLEVEVDRAFALETERPIAATEGDLLVF